MKWEYHIFESHIPALEAMRRFKQWVVRKGKIPHQPNSKKAKVSDPQTWSKLDEVLAAAQEYDGIGFVFTKDDPFIFIDLDHVLNQAGEVEPAWAKELVEKLDSYTEISPSGDGLHIFTKGIIPSGWKNKVKFDDGSALEVYSSGRYSTVTLNVYEGRDTIKEVDVSILEKYLKPEPRNTAIKPQNHPLAQNLTLDDESIIQKMQERGEWPAVPKEGDNWSDLDMGFANRLAFWCAGDLAQMDRIYRQSPLYTYRHLRKEPNKWDKRHYATGETYGEYTLRKAVQDVGDSYSPHYKSDTNPFDEYKQVDQGESKPVDLKSRLLQFALTKEKAREMRNIKTLIPNLLAERHHTHLFGAAGSLKSSVTAKLMVDLAKRGYKIHYWGFDTNVGFNSALLEIIEDEGLSPTDDFLLLVGATVRDFYEYYQATIATKEDLDDVVIVIDTYKFIVGNINDKKENAKAMHFIKDLQRLGATILSLGHTNKDGKLQSGTAEIEQDSDGLFKIEAITDGETVQVEIKKAGRVRFAYEKSLLFSTKVVKDGDEVLRWKKFLANIEPVDDDLDIEELRKAKEQEEKDKHLIQGVQALLRSQGGSLMQKDILRMLKEDDDFAGYGKDRILALLNNPHYVGKYWRVERRGERNHIKEYHLIDTTQRVVDRIKERL